MSESEDMKKLKAKRLKNLEKLSSAPSKYLSIDWNMRWLNSHQSTLNLLLVESEPELSVIANYRMELGSEFRLSDRFYPVLRKSDFYDWNPPFKKNQFLNLTWEILTKLPIFFLDLHKVFARIKEKPKLIILQDAGFINVMVMAYWVKKLDVKCVCCLHTIRGTRLLGLFKGYLKKRKDLLLFIALEEFVAERLSETVQLKTMLLPFPTTKYVDEERGEAPPYQVSILGNDRPEKGWDTVVQMVPLIEDLCRTGMIKFQLPEPMKSQLLDQGVQSDFLDLYVKFHPVNLEDAYHQKIYMSHIVLVPYHYEFYEQRCSGVTEDSRALGTPYIITSGIFTQKKYAHEATSLTFDEGNPEDLARAIKELVKSYDAFAERASSVSREVAERGDAGNYLKKIKAFADIEN